MQRKIRAIGLMMALGIPFLLIGMQALEKKHDETAGEQKKRSSSTSEKIVTSQEREFPQADYKNKYGLAEQAGRANQDRSAIEITDNYAFFGVFDGHGGRDAGHKVAEYASKSLWKNCDLTGPVQIGEIKKALRKGFLKTDKDLESSGIDARMVGSTATVAVIRENMLVVASVGDSRAVLSRNGTAIALSEDHKANRVDERDRIEDAEGMVVFYQGTWRVNSIIAMSRALGDKGIVGDLGARLVIPEPEFREINPLLQDDEFIILACDGVWDVLSNQQAVDIVRAELQEKSLDLKNLTGADYNQAALTLLRRARGNTNDDLTVIVVGLK